MNDLIEQKLLNRYRVESYLGRGAMAEVYKVFDEVRMLHLAMKILNENLAVDRVFMRRFEREAVTLAKLQHPNIVRFYGMHQDGAKAFMLLELVQGVTLAKDIFTNGGPVSEDKILRVFRALCGALQYAHNEGYVNCDIKSENIMLDESGQIFLADFGIARLMDAATITMVGAGTPAYMAPEQIKGKDPTPLIDIYALGIVLYEMATGGERPFNGDLAKTNGSASNKVRWEQINLRPPSPRTHNPQLSKELEAVILKCLEKVPGRRFGSALELLNALEAAIGTTSETPAKVEQSRTIKKTRSSTAANPSPQPHQLKTKLHPTNTRRIPVWSWGIALGLLVALFVVGSDRLGAIGLQIDPSDNAVVNLEPNDQTTTDTIKTFTSSTPTHTLTPMPSVTPTTSPCADINFGGEWAGTLTSQSQEDENAPTIIINFTQIGCDVIGTKNFIDHISGLTYVNAFDGKIVEGQLIIKNCDICSENIFQIIDGKLIGIVYNPDGTINYQYLLQRVL